MQCPGCGSTGCRRLEVIYDEGTASLDTTSHTSGVAGGVVGRHLAFGVGSASTTTSGVSRSRLAQIAAPPAAKPVLGWFIVGFIALVAFTFISFGSHWLLDSSALALAILCACAIVWAAWWNSTKLPELQRHWRSEWMCGACGQTFVP